MSCCPPFPTLSQSIVSTIALCDLSLCCAACINVIAGLLYATPPPPPPRALAPLHPDAPALCNQCHQFCILHGSAPGSRHCLTRLHLLHPFPLFFSPTVCQTCHPLSSAIWENIFLFTSFHLLTEPCVCRSVRSRPCRWRQATCYTSSSSQSCLCSLCGLAQLCGFPDGTMQSQEFTNVKFILAPLTPPHPPPLVPPPSPLTNGFRLSNTFSSAVLPTCLFITGQSPLIF